MLEKSKISPFIENLLKFSDNQIAIEDYITFCLSGQDACENYETHHILPKSLFPEFRRESWNLVKLTPINHYYAHFKLTKFLNHKNIIYAFNMMHRIKVNHDVTDEHYNEFRRNFAILMKTSNTGRKHSIEAKQKMSESRIGMAIYKNPETNEHKRYAIGCQPSNWVHSQVGRTHTPDTKHKIGGGLRGKVLSIDEFNNKTFIAQTESYVRKVDVEQSDRAKDRFTNLTYANNGEHNIRCSADEIPTGYVIGRLNFGENGNPFSNKMVCKNILTGVTTLRPSEYYDWEINPATKFVFATPEITFANKSSVTEYFGIHERNFHEHAVSKIPVCEVNPLTTWVRC